MIKTQQRQRPIVRRSISKVPNYIEYGILIGARNSANGMNGELVQVLLAYIQLVEEKVLDQGFFHIPGGVRPLNAAHELMTKS
eukprot:CAMPEP_0194049478 /NCGR_PEP_ID=MMETSP0009_2-20130614/30699_1 /TAXON_ID=210454 /ORGANISM="Grammatophora oceanica, Strain CCMP 410" /LENGTH=82 /DNA_ID=CAMNT_0038695641 /DNA_START=428 /DNA_END=676 /DNA_ORIENTATION=-